MICFSAIVAHPAIAVPSIGKGAETAIPHTMAAFDRLKQELYARQVTTLIILSPHIPGPQGNLTINQSKQVALSLKDFGDLSPYGDIPNNIGLAYQLRQAVETSIPVKTGEQNTLDYASSITLLKLREPRQPLSIISVGTAADLDIPTHIECGRRWRKLLESTNERLAIVATADLTHDIKGQDSSDCLALDRKLITWIEKGDLKAMAALPDDNPLVHSVCGLRPIALLLGLLQDQNYSLRPLSFERSVGIGYYNAIIDLR